MSKADHFVPIGKPPVLKTLPAEPVDNVVEYARRGMKFPFRLKVGERCDLGMFLNPKLSGRNLKFPVGAMAHHGRSNLVARVVFEDNEGRRWRDLNIKGMGGSDTVGERPIVVPPDGTVKGDAPYGLCDWGYAETDREKSEYFLKRGLRTHLVPFILRLKEIVVAGGEKITIQEARKRGIIGKDEEGRAVVPVLQGRAFRTWARVQNANEAHVVDAMRLVASELGVSHTVFGPSQYLDWFARELGKQVAILHSHHHTHKYLNEQNVTLACEITDLDSVGKFSVNRPDWSRIEGDLVQAEGTLRSLTHRVIQNFGKIHSSSGRSAMFLKSYVENLKDEGVGILKNQYVRHLLSRHRVLIYR